LRANHAFSIAPALIRTFSPGGLFQPESGGGGLSLKKPTQHQEISIKQMF